MIAASGAHHHLTHLKTCVGTAGYTGRDDEVGVEGCYQFGCSHRCVHLADATLLHHYLVVADAAHHECATGNGLFLLVGRKRLQLCKLLVHRYYNTYAHYFFTWITRYLLVDQKSCGLLMRRTYCLLASCCKVYELDGCMVRILADLE